MNNKKRVDRIYSVQDRKSFYSQEQKSAVLRHEFVKLSTQLYYRVSKAVALKKIKHFKVGSIEMFIKCFHITFVLIACK